MTSRRCSPIRTDAGRRYRRPGRGLACILALALAAAFAGAAIAQPRLDIPTTSIELESDRIEKDLLKWNARLQELEAAIAEAEQSTASYEEMRATAVTVREEARDLGDRLAGAIAPLQAQFDALGAAPEPPQTEDAVIAAERADLTARLAALGLEARKTELIHARASTAVVGIDQIIRQRFMEDLITVGPSPLAPTTWRIARSEIIELGEMIAAETSARVGSASAARERRGRAPLILLGLAASILMIHIVVRKLPEFLHRHAGEDASRLRLVGLGAGATLVRLTVPPAAVATLAFTISNAVLLGHNGEVALRLFAIGAVIVIVARALAQTYYEPEFSPLRLSKLKDADAAKASRRARGMGLALAMHVVIVTGGEELGSSAETLSVLNIVTLLYGAWNMWFFAAYVHRRETVETADDQDEEDLRYVEDEEDVIDESALASRVSALIAFVLRTAAAVAPALAAAGYYGASYYSFYPLILSVALVSLGVIIYRALREAVDAQIAASPESGTALRLLPVVVAFLMGCVSIPLLALIWGARTADLSDAWRLALEGVDVSGVRISPMAMFTFVLVFIIGYMITRLLQAVLATSVLPQTKLDTGGRAALTSGLGYVGIALALIVAIAAAGIDMSSLAIVAGALSVGIGFGLQTIVNNFVSGIILLAERPIKTGDWIELGQGQMGTVRKVSVRATEIETFDRSTLIVPNSELVSNSVTNYTHTNKLGRAILPVRVAFGSDVRKLERILNEVADSDRRVLRYPAPQVLFTGYGESSLNFELRVILRDVNLVLNVRSDLFFEIERRLREEGMHVPYPQQVMHMAADERIDRVLDVVAPPPPSEEERGDEDADTAESNETEIKDGAAAAPESRQGAKPASADPANWAPPPTGDIKP